MFKKIIAAAISLMLLTFANANAFPNPMNIQISNNLPNTVIAFLTGVNKATPIWGPSLLSGQTTLASNLICTVV